MEAFHEIVVPPENFPAIVLIHSPENNEMCELHWHESIELLASLDSHLHIICGQDEFDIMENDIALINSSLIHRISPVDGHAIVSLSLRLDAELFKNYSMGNHYWFDLNQNSEARQNIADCCRKLYELYTFEKDNPALLLEANALVFHIAYLMATHLCISRVKHPQSHSEKYNERYHEIMLYMNENYNKPLTLNDIAKRMHLSKEHLSREFSFYVGEGFRNHLANLRLIKAQKDLLSSDLPLIDIAIQHGFSDLRAYNRAFQKCYGISPAQYRRTYNRQNNN